MRKLLALLSFAVVLALIATPIAATLAQGDTIPGAGLVKGPDDQEAKTLNAGGATFPRPLYDYMFATDGSVYNKLTGVKVNYNAQGSGFGISNIQNQTLDFGGSDGPMTDQQLKDAKGGNVLHIPATMGGVVLIYNIPELKEPLKLTPETLALIYFGDYSADTSKAWFKDFKPLIKWNDARLVADNPGLKDLDKVIFPVRRADSSGTTNIFTSYLSAVSKEWQEQVGAANAVRWPTGQSGRQNAGVAAAVLQTPYSIGYVESSYARANNQPAALIKNKAGKFVEATQASVSAAAAGVQLPDDMRVKIVNGDGEGTYPIAGFTWLLIYENQTDAAKARAVARLAWWMVTDAQKIVSDAGKVTDSKDPLFVVGGYVPLPTAAITKAQALIAKINVGGKVALPDEILQSIKK